MAGDNGVHVFSNGATLITVGNRTITATDTSSSTITGSATVAVTSAAASTLTITAPASASAAIAFNVTVTAEDSFGNTAPGYRGTVHFTKTDTATTSAVPADYKFVAGDAGVHVFTGGVTLVTLGAQTVTATDTVSSTVTGSAAITVNPPPVVNSRSALLLQVYQRAAAFTVTVTALNVFNNTVTGYTGKVHFTKTDSSATSVVPADYTFVAADNGVHVFTNGVTLNTAGVQTVTATDTVSSTVTGSAAVTVTPLATTNLVVTAPSIAVANVPFTVTVKAADQFNNTATSYTGTVHFTKSDTAVGSAVPADYTFVAADNGVHVFSGTNSFTLVTTGLRTITATDTVTSTITGSAW